MGYCVASPRPLALQHHLGQRSVIGELGFVGAGTECSGRVSGRPVGTPDAGRQCSRDRGKRGPALGRETILGRTNHAMTATTFPIAAPAKTKTAATIPIARSGRRSPCLRRNRAPSIARKIV